MATAEGNRVLEALDSAKTQSYHFKAIVIAGMGFFTDAYDLFVIGSLNKLLGRIYYSNPLEPGDKVPSNPGVLPVNVLAAVNGTALCGTLAGQLFFGWAGDKFGRKKVYGITLLLMIIASLGQGLSLSDTPTSVIATLLFFRFWLGFGIGGDYPLSATIMSEYSNKRTRGAFVAAVFAMQGIGYLVAATVTIVITAIFNHAYHRPYFTAANVTNIPYTGDLSTPRQADFVWRIVLMFGAVPAALTFYSRSKMPETARYTALIQRDQQRAALDMASVLHTHFDTGAEFTKAVQPQKNATEYGLFSRQFARRHGLEIIGTCLTWFLLDISFYSQNLSQSQIFAAVNWIPAAKNMNGLEETFKNAKAQAIIALIGTIPGYWFTVVFVDRVGRKPIQLMGFFFMSLFLFVLAFEFYNFDSGNKTSHAAFIIVYGLIFFFCNFGPNATTFIVPAELFPARLRSTCHGISAACGKAGAIVGTFGFIYASVDKRTNLVNKIPTLPTGYHHWGIGYKWSFFLLAISAVVGFFVTLICIPETKGRSLENLSGENDDNPVTDGNLEKEVK